MDSYIRHEPARFRHVSETAPRFYTSLAVGGVKAAFLSLFFRCLQHNVAHSISDSSCYHLLASDLDLKLRLGNWGLLILGEGSSKFKSKLGKLVRTHIPITYHDWRVVPDAYKEDVWNDAMMEKKKDGQPEPTRVEVWIESHTSKDGTIPTSLAPQVDKVKAKQKELMQNASENIDQSTSLACDALSYVFGKDTRGRTRGVGSTVSRSSIEASLPAVYLLETERVEGREVKGRLN
ncbi:hypothetical protein LguiA_009120 [Lonicera macranthoides]